MACHGFMSGTKREHEMRIDLTTQDGVRIGVLTTEHVEAGHGMPVVLVTGEHARGPADRFGDVEAAFVVHEWASGKDDLTREEREAANAFLRSCARGTTVE